MSEQNESWHHIDASEVLHNLDSTADGLSEEEAATRLEQYGANTLEAVDKPGWLRRLAHQFHDVLIYILSVAAVLTAYLQEWVDTAVIAAVVIINAVIGFVQEGRAEEALEEIRAMLTSRATVVRGGKRHNIDAESLVPGDVVWLESGDRVPADVRLLEVNELRVEEALLTGESEPTTKSADAVAADAPLGDRRSMAFSGTVVVKGTARAVVVATGERTEVGRIGEMVAGVEELKTPLIRKIDRFGLWLSGIILAAAGALFAFGWFARPFEFAELMMLSVSLAVAAIPEGLPAIMTITLALGVRRMADRNAIIRKLPAVETLGSVTVICSDKTGTLTRNEMTVHELESGARRYRVVADDDSLSGHLESDNGPVTPGEDAQSDRLVRVSALCNDAEIVEGSDDSKNSKGWHVEGEPTEAALVVLAARAGFRQGAKGEAWRRIDTVPFDSERRFMATLHDTPDEERVVFLKGAPETVMELCDRQLSADGDEAISPETWQRAGDELAAEGYRVLAVAQRRVDADTAQVEPEDVDGQFVLLGLVAMMDPPRPEAIEAVKGAQKAGIRVKMITGDHAETARSIGERMNIGRGTPAVTGRDIEEADDERVAVLSRDHDVFARTSPEHKLRIVEALQRQDEVVAMTGDGVNDAPALKRADVGIAMGQKGTEATKQAAEMVLADDNFASIERAIAEGRTIYDNLKKTILFLLPTNGAEALMVLAAVVLAMEHLPITPVQILWVNMVTAVTLALALAFEPPENNVMERPPRPPDEPIISGRGIFRIGLVAVVIGALAMGSFFGARADGASVELARTIGINTLVAGQLFYLFSSRFLVEPAYLLSNLLSNKVALIASAVLVILQLVFTYTAPFHLWFGTEAMSVYHWLWALGGGASVFVLVEAEKGLRRIFGD